MANIDNPDSGVLAEAGIVGVQGPAIDNGRGQYVMEAINPEALPDADTGKGKKLDEPALVPDLKSLGEEKDTHLRKTLKALQNGANENKYKLSKEEHKELKALRKKEGRPQDWPAKVRALLRKVDRDGSLAKKLKASGLSAKDPKAEQYAIKVAQEGDAPKPSSAKVDPKTGRVITAKELKAIQAKSTVYVRQDSLTATKLRKNDGYDDVMAQEAPALERGHGGGIAALKSLSAHVFYKTAGRATLSQVQATGVLTPNLVHALKMHST